MIVLRSEKGYLASPYHGYLAWVASIEDARKFEGLEDFIAKTYNWERDALSLLTIEEVTIL